MSCDTLPAAPEKKPIGLFSLRLSPKSVMKPVAVGALVLGGLYGGLKKENRTIIRHGVAIVKTIDAIRGRTSRTIDTKQEALAAIPDTFFEAHYDEETSPTSIWQNHQARVNFHFDLSTGKEEIIRQARMDLNQHCEREFNGVVQSDPESMECIALRILRSAIIGYLIRTHQLEKAPVEEPPPPQINIGGYI